MKLTQKEIDEAAARLHGASPRDVLTWALERFGASMAIASSFSIEDCVLVQMAHAIQPRVRVFALDTGRLPEETYLVAERMRAKYDINIEWQFPERGDVEKLVRLKGLYSFRDSLEDRHECCGIRKVAPLRKALAGLDAWVTGRRREQSVTRTNVFEVEVDPEAAGLVKINPLIGWTGVQVRSYADEHRVPIHPLHDKGYPSIGCAPCTRAIGPGDHPRAGRWWWEDPENKECGLHVGKT